MLNTCWTIVRPTPKTISPTYQFDPRMDLGLEQELKPSPSADPDSETTGERSTPQGGNWEPGLRIADGSMLVDMRSKTGADESSPPEREEQDDTSPEHACTQIGAYPDETNITSEESKTYDPGGKEENLALWKRPVRLLFFNWGELGASSTCVLFLLPCVFGFSFSCVSLFFPIHFFHR